MDGETRTAKHIFGYISLRAKIRVSCEGLSQSGTEGTWRIITETRIVAIIKVFGFPLWIRLYI